MERILVIAAHPDDEVLGCGATIFKLSQLGKVVKVLILGEGSTCRYQGNEITSEIAQAAILQRTSFAKDSMKVLGVDDYSFLNYPCGRFDTIPLIELGQRIESVIDDFQPDTVFTHSAFDTNNDHKLSFQAALQATRPFPSQVVQRLLSYEVLSSTEWSFSEAFKPNYFIDITKSIDAKIEAFNCYSETESGEFPHPRCDEGLLILAKQRGMQVGLKYAEAFVMIRDIKK
jgi:LmbE family N-acetylglucosaminyl deacetylase